MNIESVFENMDYGQILQSDAEAKKWIESHQGVLSSMISRYWKPSTLSDIKVDVFDKFRKDKLVSLSFGDGDLAEAVQSTRDGISEWFSTSSLIRSQLMRSVSAAISKNCSILSILESMSTGRLIKNVNSSVIPQAVGHFQYIAEWPCTHEYEYKNYKPLGVYIVVLPSNASLCLATQKLAPAIAAGNGVVLYLDGSSTKSINLALYYFLELLSKMSFPNGIINVVYNTKPLIAALLPESRVDGITYVGQMKGAQELQQFISGSGVKLNLFLNFKYTVAIFKCGDMESAMEAAVEAIKYSAENEIDCLILIQEGVFNNALRLLKNRLLTLRSGSSLNVTVDLDSLTSGRVTALIDHLVSVDPCFETQIQLLGLDIVPFRTAKEALELANDCITDVRASIWTENVTLAFEVARKLNATTIWVNCINQYNAAVTVGNRKQSGGAWDLGKEAFYQCVKHIYSNSASLPYGTVTADTISSFSNSNMDSVKKAVDMATKSQSGWNSVKRIGRAKVLWAALDAIVEGKQQFREQLIQNVKCSADEATANVEGVIGLLDYWASHSDNGRVYDVNFRGTVMKIVEPVGVIVIALSDGIQFAVSTFVALVLSAVALGNSVIVIPGGNQAALASSVLQVLTKGGLPSGVMNILPNSAEVLLPSIYNCNVQDVWFVGSEPHLAAAEFLSGLNHLQPTCVRTGFSSSLWDNPTLAEEFFVRAEQGKLLWIPSGVTFAN